MQNDPYSWNTQTLVGVAARVTPADDLDNWVATRTGGSWDVSAHHGPHSMTDPDAVFWSKGEVTERMCASELREYVIEQLQHYDITEGQINRMKS
jgi:hypothetical protein